MTQRQSNRSDPGLKAKERNEELTRQALKIIDQGPALKSMVEEDVEYVQRVKATKKAEWDDSLRHGVPSKHARRAAAKIAAALYRLRLATKPLEEGSPDISLRYDLRRTTYSGLLIDFPIDNETLEEWRKHFQEIADIKVRVPSRFDARKLQAVRCAADLLIAAGLPLSHDQRTRWQCRARVPIVTSLTSDSVASCCAT